MNSYIQDQETFVLIEVGNMTNIQGEEADDDFKLLKCPKCGGLLIRVNEVKENQIVTCKWMCISPSCRKGLYFDTYYGNTQEGIDNNLKDEKK